MAEVLIVSRLGEDVVDDPLAEFRRESPLAWNAGMGEGIRAIRFREKCANRRLEGAAHIGVVEQIQELVESSVVGSRPRPRYGIAEPCPAHEGDEGVGPFGQCLGDDKKVDALADAGMVGRCSLQHSAAASAVSVPDRQSA